MRYKGINTFNGALDDVYKDLYNCRFYKEDMDGKSYVDKRRKLDNGLDNPNRDKRYWILEDRTDISKSKLAWLYEIILGANPQLCIYKHICESDPKKK